MRAPIRILLCLFLLCLCGCKTKQKVTENLTETVQASKSSTQQTTGNTEQQGVSYTREETTQTQCSDSVVEKFRERIVTDSCGRVLLHEVEQSREKFEGNNKSQTNRTGHHQENSTSKDQELKQTRNDSIYNGGTFKETIYKKNSFNWEVVIVPFSLVTLTLFVILLKIRK